jgi:hypothetical protein
MTDHLLLPELLRRECRSYLQYIRESYPWAKGKEEDLRGKVLALAEAENQALSGLARSMQKQRIMLPYMGAFPTAFTTSNFLAISYLLPKLTAQQRQAIGVLERDLPMIADARLREQFQTYLDLKRRHLVELEGLAKPLAA